ncbi:MAG TPA: DUF4352 domain-containing protein [Candidatus Saccharimonadales bacterium]|nr:DUF4352 domain-containing protein [Candidatus Saccharimonadales bacterium]
MGKKDKSGNWFGRHKILTVIGGLVVLIIIGAAIGGNKKTPSSNQAASNTSSSTKSTATTASTPTLNQQANDGKFGFTITSFQCNVSQIEQPDDTDYVVTAGAPYCEMNLSVKDVSTVAQTFDSDSQYVYGPSGNQYSVDDTATIAANNTSSNCMEDPTVNPGVTITCTLAFDVPGSVTPSYAMLHDSSLSNGVKVNLQ